MYRIRIILANHRTLCFRLSFRIGHTAFFGVPQQCTVVFVINTPTLVSGATYFDNNQLPDSLLGVAGTMPSLLESDNPRFWGLLACLHQGCFIVCCFCTQHIHYSDIFSMCIHEYLRRCWGPGILSGHHQTLESNLSFTRFRGIPGGSPVGG